MPADVENFTLRNGEEIVLRTAECEDAGQMIEVIRTDAPDRSYVLMEHYGARPDSIKAYICGIDAEKNLLLVAVSGDRVIAVLSGIQMGKGKIPHTAHVMAVGLHVMPQYRGMGIGTRMLDYAARWAKGRGFEKLEADIFTTNKRSLHLFERAGFIEEGTRQKRIRIGKQYIDEILLGKIL